MMMMMMMMWLVLSPPSHLQLIAKGRIDECGVKRNSPKGRLALNTVIGFHRIIVIVVVIIVLFILHILHIAQRVSGLTLSDLNLAVGGKGRHTENLIQLFILILFNNNSIFLFFTTFFVFHF